MKSALKDDGILPPYEPAARIWTLRSDFALEQALKPSWVAEMPETIHRLTYSTHMHICCLWWPRICMETCNTSCTLLLRVTHTQAFSCQQAVYTCREYGAVNQSTIEANSTSGSGVMATCLTAAWQEKFSVNKVMAGPFPCW